MTCARIAPTASARSRTFVSSCPCPRSSVTAMISASYLSASQRIATEVSSPPEYARTIRFISHSCRKKWLALSRTVPATFLMSRVSGRPPAFQSLRKARRVGRAATDDEDRVVACNRADDLRQPGPIDRDSQWLRLPRVGLQHDELIDDVQSAKVVIDGRSAFRFQVA